MDKVYEAYMGDMGEKFAEKTQKRIHWICSKVQGEKVLDVGCSQGITAILLARRGIHVTGLDINEGTVSQAREFLAKEPEEIQKRVEFCQADFGSYDALEQYDTVIMGEVLEHLLHPQIFIANAEKVLKDDGVLIITVPFGINEDPDHKQTFYYFGLEHLLNRYFRVSETFSFGKWIGFVARKAKLNENSSEYAYEQCLYVEQAFYAVEREYLDEQKRMISDCADYTKALQEKLKKSEENYQTAKQWVEGKNISLEQMNRRNTELKEALDAADAQKLDLENRYREQKQSIEQLEKLLKDYEVRQASFREKDQEYTVMQTENARLKERLQQKRQILSDSEVLLEGEEDFLKSIQREVHTLKQELARTKWKAERYDALHDRLANSWYGKIALVCYRRLRKIKEIYRK